MVMQKKSNLKYLYIILLLFLVITLTIVYTQTYFAVKKKQEELAQVKLSALTHKLDTRIKFAQDFIDSVAKTITVISKKEHSDIKSSVKDFLDKELVNSELAKNDSCTSLQVKNAEWVAVSELLPPQYSQSVKDIHFNEFDKLSTTEFKAKIFQNQNSTCMILGRVLDDKKSIISLSFDIPWIDLFLDETKKRVDPVGFIIDQSGQILVSTQDGEISKDSLMDYGGLLENIYNFYGNYFRYEFEDKEYVVFSEKIELGWYLVVLIPDQKIFFGENIEIVTLYSILFLLFLSVFATILLFNSPKIISFLKLLSAKKEQKLDEYSKENRSTTFKIVAILTFTAVATIAVNTYSQLTLLNKKMEQDLIGYEKIVNEWMVENIAKLDAFSLSLSTVPQLTQERENFLRFLDKIGEENSGILASYIVQTDKNRTLISNNPNINSYNFKENEPQWYSKTLSAQNGMYISTPSKKIESGENFITMSKQLVDENGRIRAIFAIDVSMDTLVHALDKCYTQNSYVFLVDKNFKIINHPCHKYQTTKNNIITSSQLGYREAIINKTPTLFKDFDGEYRVAIVEHIDKIGLSIVFANRWFYVYAPLIFYNLIIVTIFVICIFIIISFMKHLKKWQKIVNSKLEDAVDKAVAAGSAKSEFLANMSHEIRTPINVILGMNEMVLRKTQKDEIKEYALNIENAGKSLIAIINDILDFSKIESNKMEIVEDEYDVVQFIDHLVLMVEHKAREKDIDIVLSIDPNIPKKLIGDDMRLRQIAINLLTNAIKYTSVGNVTLQMLNMGTFYKDGRAFGNFKIAVKDTGIGINKEDISKLFVAFKRVDIKKNRAIEGSGLGISIVQKLLTMMGSSLKVSSVYGEGSVFEFVIAQEIADGEPIGKYERSLAKKILLERRVEFMAPNAKILVVDDNQMNLQVVKNLLEKIDSHVVLCESGFEAIKILEAERFDLVFLDHMMPNLDGVETLQKIKDKEIAATTPFIVLTANALVGAKNRYLEFGFDDYLSKPIIVKELEQILQKWLPKNLIITQNILQDERVDLSEKLASSTQIDFESALKYADGKVEILTQNIRFFYKMQPKFKKI